MRKKVVVFFLSVLAIAAMSCQNPLQDTDTGAGTSDSAFVESKPIVVEASNKMSESFQSYIALQAEYLTKSYDLIEQYIDVSENVSKSASENGLSLKEFGNLLPDDISNLTRTIVVRGTEEEITLEQELTELENNFENERKEILPNTTDAKKLDYLKIDDNNIYIGGVGIPLNSIEGVITVEMHNAISRGEDVEQILTALQDDMENTFLHQFEAVADENVERGVYEIERYTPRWPNGVVNYRWGNSISSPHKEALQEAMDDWSNSTGEISFDELPNTWWNNFLVTLGIIKGVTYNTTDNVGVANSNSWGYRSWQAVNLNSDYFNDDPDYLNATCLHELGHILGLYHEHQRRDRDSYVVISAEEAKNWAKYWANFRKLDGKFLDVQWKSTRVRILWWTVTVWYPVFNSYYKANMVGSFDFDSIMLYSHLEIREPYKDANGEETKTNYTLSPTDIATIKEMY